jgi:hypothetical protein
MKKLIGSISIVVILSLYLNIAFTQNTTPKKSISQNEVNIDVPNFADPAIKRFYEAHTFYLKKAVSAVRSNDEAAIRKLNKEPREIEELRQQTYKTKPTPDDVKKKQAWNKQAMPYIMEMQQSHLIKKLEKEEEEKMNR